MTAVAPWRRDALIGGAVAVYAAFVMLTPGAATKAALCVPLAAIPLFCWMLGSPLRWLQVFFVAALLLPPLPVDIGNSGPHVALLFAGFGLFAGLLRLPEFKVRMDALSISLLAIFAAMFASIAMAVVYSGFVIAAASFARVLLFGISIYVFMYVRSLETGADRMLKLLFAAAAGSALFACLDFYFQFPAPAGFGAQFIWLESGVFRRAQGFFYEASTLGNLCAFFLEMIAVALFRPRDERPLSLAAMLAGGTLLAAALVLSYSRASLVNLAVALCALAWLYRKRIRFGRVALAAAILGAAAALILSLFPVFTQAYWARIAMSLQYFLESPNAVLSGRLQSWRVLSDFLLAHPWHALLGVGYKTLPYSDFIGGTAIADNTYLSMLAETGIAGLAALIAVNIAILTTAYRAARSPDRTRSFCGAWMFCFWAGQLVQMLSADLLTYWRVLPVYMFVLAVAAGKMSGSKDEHPVPRSIQ